MAKTYKFRERFTFEGKRYDVKANTKKKLTEKVAQKKHELLEGKKKLVSPNTTVKEWGNTCFDQYKTDVEPITLSNQKSKANKWIFDSIGSMRLKDVKPLHCQGIMNQMGAEGKALDTCRKVRQLMQFFFEKAVENGLLHENPAKYITTPKAGKETRRAITEEERQAIIETAKKDPQYTYFLFMLYCGCRPSEVAGIQGKDFSVENGELMLHIRGTKTKAADRYVPVPDQLKTVMPIVAPTCYLFTNARGGKLSEQNRQALWRRFRRELNITMGCQVYRNQLVPPYPVAEDLVPYCLRHTYCTDLCKMGIDIRTAQYLMGHSDIKLTANIYTHTDTNTVANVAKLMRENA